MMTEEELRQLAMDIVDGKVFTSDQIDQGSFANIIRMIFMPIGLADAATLASLREREVTMLYEYYSEAGQRSINGYPMFMSMRTVSRTDHTKLSTIAKRYSEMKQQFAKSDDGAGSA